MRFAVELIESKDAFAMCCPAWPGCWSQGETREAIALWQEVAVEDQERELGAIASAFPASLSPFDHRKAVTKISGISQREAVRAFEKVGSSIIRQSGPIVRSDGKRRLTIPRANPVNAFTMGGIAKDTGLSPEAFRNFL
jgi:predicted RNase H-like HicB family nuclease